MPDTAKLGITKIEASQSQKEVTANAAFDKLDKAIAGYEDIDIAGGAGNQTLSADEQMNSAIVLSGTITGARNVIVSTGKKWHFFNDCDGAYTVTVKTAAGTGVEIPAGEWREVMNDGTNVVEIGGGGGGGGGTWGSITGTLSDQTDLQSALDGKADDGDIPTELPDLTDFPASYTGHAGKLVVVKNAEDGVEFVERVDALSASMTQVVGDGTTTSFSIAHNFGSLDLLVQVREATDSGDDGYVRIDTGFTVIFYDTDTVVVEFDSAPSAGQYSVYVALPWIRGDATEPSPGSSVFGTAGEYEFVVPQGIDVITAKVWGAGGGGVQNPSGIGKTGGGGGFAQADLTVTPGEVLTIKVGAGGAGFTYSQNSGAGGAGESGARGGGLSGILRGGTPLLIGGSGGGAGICGSTDTGDSAAGGDGGGTSGTAGGSVSTNTGGGGGTQSAGGSVSAGSGFQGLIGTSLAGGDGGSHIVNTHDGYGGFGGAGYFGGGGGGGVSNNTQNSSGASGGGGGSGYVSGANTTLTAASSGTAANTGDADYVTGVGAGGAGGANGGAGRIVISWG